MWCLRAPVSNWGGGGVSSTVGVNSKLASDCRVLGSARQDGSCNEIIALCPPPLTPLLSRKTWLKQPAWWQEMGTLQGCRSVATSFYIFACTRFSRANSAVRHSTRYLVKMNTLNLKVCTPPHISVQNWSSTCQKLLFSNSEHIIKNGKGSC